MIRTRKEIFLSENFNVLANIQQRKWFEYFISDILGNLYLPFKVFIVCKKTNPQNYIYIGILSMGISYTLYSIELGWGLLGYLQLTLKTETMFSWTLLGVYHKYLGLVSFELVILTLAFLGG